MISTRFAISRSILAGRGTPNAGAAFLQANVPFVSTSDRPEKDNTNAVSVRHNTSLTSPAYKRWVKSSNFGLGQKPSIGALNPGLQEPTLKVARDMGKTFSEMENEPLIIIAEMGNHAARAEALRRHIMATDYVDYKEAGKTLEKIAKVNRRGLVFFRFPYQFGIVAAVVTGIGAFPMVFDVELAKIFNDAYVTMEVPMPSELDTPLETGAWTWNWMEPVLGTASFTLLALQFARQQLLNLGIKPATEWLMVYRTNKLCKTFPQYNKHLLANFVKSEPMSALRL